jgi:hypothetical protein
MKKREESSVKGVRGLLTSGPAHTVTSSQNRWIGTYPIGITILGKIQLFDSQLVNQGQFSQNFIFSF